MRIEHWIDNSIYELKTNGVKVILSNTLRVKANKDDPDACEGYFSDGPELILAVAKKNKNWKEVFVHEYCHYLQYKYQTDLWKEVGNSDIKLTEWLAGKNSNIITVKTWINKIQAMERQCEDLVLFYAKYYKLFSLRDYAKGANAYLYFYSILHKTRKWYKIPPDTSIILKSLMPSKLLKDHSSLSKELEEIMIKECYK
jgi:hypothetical protein